MRIGVGEINDRIRVSVFAKNLFNKHYYTDIGSSGTLGVAGAQGTPRFLGVEVETKF